MAENLKDMYKNINRDSFPQFMDISFRNSDSDRQTLFYEKVQWDIGGEKLGLRYGENPDQPAAMYKLINGNLAIGGVETVLQGRYLASDVELLQSGKHPGKINITDVDNGLNILRFFSETPCSVIIKHNNPSGVAKGETLAEAFHKSLMADRIAAFGGAVILNREVDLETAEQVTEGYVEVVAAPEFSPKAFELFQSKKNLRVMRIKNIDKLQDFAYSRFMDFKSILDGGVIAQWSYLPKARKKEDFLPAVCEYKGKEYRVNRQPTDKEFEDIIFGWLVESGVTSNSVIYVKDGVTVGIGTGEQDRVGVAEIARDKAYKKMCDRICWDLYEKSGISTILVAGSSGAYFYAADTILQMDRYVPKDITKRVKDVLAGESVPEEVLLRAADYALPDTDRPYRINSALRKTDRLKIKTLSVDSFLIDHDEVNLRGLSQIADREQTQTLAAILRYMELHLLDGTKSLSRAVSEMTELLAEKGLEVLFDGSYAANGLCEVRPQEIFCTLNRYRK